MAQLVEAEQHAGQAGREGAGVDGGDAVKLVVIYTNTPVYLHKYTRVSTQIQAFIYTNTLVYLHNYTR